MMDFPRPRTHFLRRAGTFLGNGEIVTRLPDRSLHRTTYRKTMRRARQLAVALQQLGLERGDRVATLCWNHHQHHEAYFGIPCGGFVLHTLNLRLHPNDLAYIAGHGGDRAVIVDRSLVPLLDQFRERTTIEHVFVVEDSYEELLATASPDEWRDPELDENEAAAMCYTSGTTGLPKGVCYSHRSTVLHSVGVAANNPLGIGIGVNDAILPAVPMFHANAWGYPYVAAMAGMPLPFVEIRVRIGDDELPWDGESMGELEVRGPWVASGYYDTPEQADRWTEDGWFRTGDIASIHPRGYIQIKDRSKDVIKSGGEWISSVELENALMAHPAVAEAAVIAIPDAKWAERPLAAVVLKEGATATSDDLREFLEPKFA